MNETHRSRWIPALILAALCTAVNTFQWLYTDVDNYLIAIVTNGLLGPDGYVPMLNPVLCWIVQLVSLGFPHSDAYMLTVKAVVFLGYWWAAYRILNAPKRKRFLGWLILLLVCLMCPPQLNYQVLAGLLAALGWFGLLYAARNGRWGNIVPAFTLLIFGGMFCWEAAALTLPLFLLWILPELFSPAKGRTFRTFLSSIVIIVVAAAIIAGLTAFKLYVDGFNDRSAAILKMEGAQWRDYDSLESPGFSRNDYELVRSGYLAAPDVLTTETLTEITEKGILPTVGSDWADAAVKAVTMPLDEMRSTAVLFSCLVLLLLLVCTKHSTAAKIGVLLAYVATVALEMGLAHFGRLDENACLILMFCLMFFHLMALIWGTDDSDGLWEVASFRNKLPLRRIIRSVASLIILVVTLLGSLTWILDGPMQTQLAWNARIPLDNTFFQPEDADQYLWMMEDYVQNFLTSHYMKEGTLPSEPFLLRNIPTGGWLYSCGSMSEYLKRIQTENPTFKLTKAETIHLVRRSSSDVQNFIQEHYGREFSLWETDSILNTPVFTVAQK